MRNIGLTVTAALFGFLLAFSGIARSQSLTNSSEAQQLIDQALQLWNQSKRIAGLQNTDLEAKALLEKVAAEYPKTEQAADALRHLAFGHYFKGLRKEGESYYDRLFRDYPSSRACFYAYMDLGGFMAQEGNTAEAARYYRLAADAQNENPPASTLANCDNAHYYSVGGPNVVSDPQGYPNCISGQPFSVVVKVRRSMDVIAKYYTGTVIVSVNNGSGGKIELTRYTFTTADKGVHEITGLRLTIIFGTTSLRVLYFDDNTCNIHAQINVAVWFNVFANREGLVCRTVTCGSHVDDRDHFVALPDDPRPSASCGHGVYVRNGVYLETTTWEDLGPRFDDPYWNTTGSPSDTVGIDLADGTFWDSLHMTDNGYVLWRFYH